MALSEQEPVFDTSKKYVRITNERSDGFIEFDFAIGEPEVFAELILPRISFVEFCDTNQVIMLKEKEGLENIDSEWEWRLKDATTFK